MAARRAKTTAQPPKRDIEQRIQGFAGDQLAIITAAQLAAAGLSGRSARDRAAIGRLYRMHMNVYALHGPPYSRAQRFLAAALTYERGTLISHASSGVHQKFLDPSPGPIHVISDRPSPRPRDGILVHRADRIDPRDVRRFNGVPCVSADLVLVQLASSFDIGELEVALVAADSFGFLKRGRLAELVAERRGRPGMPKLEELLALEPVLTQSDLELLFLPLWRPAGLGRPLVNHPISVPGQAKPLKVDFYWPHLRMVVEADSQRFHGDWERAEIDRERDQLLALAGRVCHRFVRRRVKADPAGCAERLRLLAEVRARDLGGVAAAA